MNKPKMKKREYLDYNECSDYLQEKYQYDDRNFWQWVIKHHEISNGCILSFERDELEYIDEDWVKEIYKRYLDEFANEDGELVMEVHW